MQRKSDKRDLERLTRVLNRLKEIEEKITYALRNRGDVDYEALSKAIGDFGERTDWLLKANGNVMSVMKILTDSYYFPKAANIGEYIVQTYSLKIPLSKSRQATAKRAALIIVKHHGEERLKSDLPHLRESLRSRPSRTKTIDLRAMQPAEIKQELEDSVKYPDIESLKAAAKGIVPSKKLYHLGSRESIIKIVQEAVERARSVRIFSRE